MINQTEKLEKFKRSVFDDVSARADELINETEAECGERIRQAKLEAEELTESKRAQIDREYQGLAVRSVSADRLESKRKILLKRESIIDKVFNNVREELEKFMKTADYEKLLIKRVEECAAQYPDKKGEVLIAPKDKSLAPKLTAGGKFTVKESGSIEIGGVTVVYPEDNLAVDGTFDLKFTQQRQSFVSRSGMSV